MPLGSYASARPQAHCFRRLMDTLDQEKGRLGPQLQGGKEYVIEYAINMYELAEIEVCLT